MAGFAGTLVRLNFPRYFIPPQRFACRSFVKPLTTGQVRSVTSHIPATKTVTLVPGDGVFPELFMAVKYVFREAGIPVAFEEYQLRYAPRFQ